MVSSSRQFLCDHRVFIALIIDVFRVSMVILLDFNSSIIKYNYSILSVINEWILTLKFTGNEIEIRVLSGHKC